MNNIWLEFIVNEFVNDKKIRCCGSCQGGCLNPAVCVFMCLDYEIADIYKWMDEKGIDNLRMKFLKTLGEE